MTNPADLYSEALSGRVDLVARLDGGITWPVDVTPWLGRASASDDGRWFAALHREPPTAVAACAAPPSRSYGIALDPVRRRLW